MTVEELINKLEKFPKNMEVLDSCWMEIEDVVEETWTDSNYPYNRPDKQVIIIK